jgi:arylamine N-acetyltransferase
LFLILKGKVNIWKRDSMLGTIKDGSFFGEMAIVVSNSVRTRTATAASSCNLCFLSRDTIVMLCHECPELDSNLVKFVSARSKRGIWADSVDQIALEQAGITVKSASASSAPIAAVATSSAADRVENEVHLKVESETRRDSEAGMRGTGGTAGEGQERRREKTRHDRRQDKPPVSMSPPSNFNSYSAAQDVSTHQQRAAMTNIQELIKTLNASLLQAQEESEDRIFDKLDSLRCVL